MTKKSRNKKSVWSNFKLRFSLFRIWFMKNILVWLQIALIVCLVCIITGNITSETPILGSIVYPFFEPLIEEITAVVVDRKIDGLMDFFAAAISILTSCSVFLLKARRISQADIKNNKLKIAMIQAGLYFNEDGKLTKKTEKLVGQDLDCDGKVDDEKKITKGLFSGIASAIKELKVIATADFSGTEEENANKFEETITEAGLKESKEALDELDRTFKVGMTNVAANVISDKLDDDTNKKLQSSKLSEDEKVNEVRKTNKLKLWIQEMKNRRIEKINAKKEKEQTADVDIITNNIDSDATVKKVNPIEEILAKKENKILTQTSKASTPSDVSSFLSKLRK